mgnify:FL=1
MPPTPSELRAAGRDWLGNLATRYQLQRRLYLVPGICNEDAQMWDTIWHWGMVSIPNWADYAERIRFETLPARDDFRDFGDYVRGLIAARYPYDPTHQVGEFEIGRAHV